MESKPTQIRLLKYVIVLHQSLLKSWEVFWHSRAITGGSSTISVRYPSISWSDPINYKKKKGPDYLSLEPSKGDIGNVLVITDHYTKYATAIPTRNQTAKTTAEALYNQFIVKFEFQHVCIRIKEQTSSPKSSKNCALWQAWRKVTHQHTIQKVTLGQSASTELC